MTTEEFKLAVLDLFRNGQPTEDQWRQMSKCVLEASENDMVDTCEIDRHCDPVGWERGYYFGNDW